MVLEELYAGADEAGLRVLTKIEHEIAASAARRGITVITANQRDFAQLSEFCSPDWQPS